jgi:hypothetical protein
VGLKSKSEDMGESERKSAFACTFALDVDGGRGDVRRVVVVIVTAHATHATLLQSPPPLHILRALCV